MCEYCVKRRAGVGAIYLMNVVVSLRIVLHIGKRFYLYEFTELNFCLLAPSWSPGH